MYFTFALDTKHTLDIERGELYLGPIYETDEYIQFSNDYRKLYKSYDIARKYANDEN